jgi:hypothetical protein
MVFGTVIYLKRDTHRPVCSSPPRTTCRFERWRRRRRTASVTSKLTARLAGEIAMQAIMTGLEA